MLIPPVSATGQAGRAPPWYHSLERLLGHGLAQQLCKGFRVSSVFKGVSRVVWGVRNGGRRALETVCKGEGLKFCCSGSCYSCCCCCCCCCC